jgi:hypothetical protein
MNCSWTAAGPIGLRLARRSLFSPRTWQRRSSLALALGALCWFVLNRPDQLAAAPSRLEMCQNITLPGVEGRFDHFACEPASQRLFVAAYANNSLEIVGLREGRRLQTISGIKKPTGVVYISSLKRIGVATYEEGAVRLYDGSTYQPKEIIRGLDHADNMRYDPVTDQVYVGYGDGALGIITASDGQMVGMVRLKAHPEAFQLEYPGHKLFINVPGAKQIAVVDAQQRDAIGTWALEKFPENYAMALDNVNHRLFAGCRKPGRLLVFNSQSGKMLAEVPLASDVDDLSYDSKRQRIYASCGEGLIDVIEQTDPDHYRAVEKVATAAGARTSFFSAELDVLAVAMPHRGNQNAEIRVFQPK